MEPAEIPAMLLSEQRSQRGKDLLEGKGEAETEVRGARAQPLPALWTPARLLEKISALPHLLSQPGPVGRDSGSNQVELVND
jgi:hypothetical protein